MMQDKFRYRVFDNDDKKMHDVIFLNYENNSVEWYNDKNKKRAAFIEEVPTVQCTGLKDKNGKLIYEGDIVSVKVETQDFFGEDEYYSENYKGEIIFEKGEIAIDVIDTTKHPISLYYHAKDCEIIGNIYENSELILEDKCKYCSVEAQAMVHRCPECKYNPELMKDGK